jgi:hypothetical protein
MRFGGLQHLVEARLVRPVAAGKKMSVPASIVRVQLRENLPCAGAPSANAGLGG